jgi:hypothetical protein
MTPQIFTDDYLSSIQNPANPLERRFSTLLATKDYFEPIRERLEVILGKYPNTYKQIMIGKIRSEDDEACLSAISELNIFDCLTREFNPIQIEPELPCLLGNQTKPDFWVESNSIFEVATIFCKYDPLELDIVETLNKIRNPIKLMLGPIRSKPDEQPRLSDIKKEFEGLLKSKESITKIEDFFFKSKTGVLFSGKVYKGDINHPTVGSVMYSQGFDKHDIDYKNTARKAIRKKLRKYSKITNLGYLLIIVLYNRNDFLLDEDWEEIVFGDREYLFDQTTARIKEVLGKNAIIQPKANKSLSALIVKDLTRPDGYILIKNPYAKTTIDGIQTRIEEAFQTRELQRSRA